MSVTVMFFAILAGLGGWWLARQRLAARPWLEQGVIEGVPDLAASPGAARRAALGFFLAVIGSLFALVIGAYFMRSEFGDWQPLPVPAQLWINTGALVASSMALEWSQASARRDDIWGLRAGLVAAALFALAFVFGQVAAWQELAAGGYALAANPANSFFYLVTGLHGLHIAGGLVAIGLTMRAAWSGRPAAELQGSVELCATYGLFMLFVWMVLFGLLAGWAGEFIALCRQLLG